MAKTIDELVADLHDQSYDPDSYDDLSASFEANAEVAAKELAKRGAEAVVAVLPFIRSDDSFTVPDPPGEWPVGGSDDVRTVYPACLACRVLKKNIEETAKYAEQVAAAVIEGRAWQINGSLTSILIDLAPAETVSRPLLFDALASGATYPNTNFIVSSLWRFGPEGADLLCQHLTHEDERTRQLAVKGLAAVGGERAHAALRDVSRSDDRELATLAAELLEKLG